MNWPSVGGAIVNESNVRVTVSRAYVNASASGSTLALAAVTGKSIRVLSVVAVATSDVTIKFLSGATPISADFPISSRGGFSMPRNVDGWFQTVSGDALNVNLSAAIATGVIFTYALV